jgi:hypothetical protein
LTFDYAVVIGEEGSESEGGVAADISISSGVDG